ncbi:MAG TPA: hypothetical protein VKV69_09845 [Actinomycetota bacterium]|nr:hypothetical protein [Actinomycetota bacterium]
MAETPEAPTPQQPDATPAKKPRSARAIQIILLVVGLVLLGVGFVYLSIVTGKLPSFLGKIPNGTTHHFKRGYAGVIAGVLCLLVAIGLSMPKKQRS